MTQNARVYRVSPVDWRLNPFRCPRRTGSILKTLRLIFAWTDTNLLRFARMEAGITTVVVVAFNVQLGDLLLMPF